MYIGVHKILNFSNVNTDGPMNIFSVMAGWNFFKLSPPSIITPCTKRIGHYRGPAAKPVKICRFLGSTWNFVYLHNHDICYKTLLLRIHVKETGVQTELFIISEDMYIIKMAACPTGQTNVYIQWQYKSNIRLDLECCAVTFPFHLFPPSSSFDPRPLLRAWEVGRFDPWDIDSILGT